MRRYLLLLLALAAGAASGEPITLAWDASPEWPAGTTIELDAGGATASGITGTQHTLDVAVEPGQSLAARARAVALDGETSAWAELVQTWPGEQSGLYAIQEQVGAPPMAAAFRSFAYGYYGATSSSTIAGTFPSVAAGDLIVVMVQRDSIANLTSITMSGATLSEIVSLGVQGGSFGSGIYAAIATSGGTNVTVTANFSDSAQWGALVAGAYSGIASATPLAYQCMMSGCTGIASDSASRTTPSALSPGEEALIVAVGSGWNYEQNHTAADSFTKRYDNATATTTQFLLDRVTSSSTGGGTAFATSGWTDNYFGALIAFEQASGSTTYTSSTSLDALVQNAGVTASASIDALLKASNSSTVSADSLLAAVRSGQVSLDALAQAAKAGTVSLDALVQAARAGTVSVDALLSAVLAEATDLDALLQAAAEAGVSLDAVLSGSTTAAAQMDALLQAGKVASASMDALLVRQGAGLADATLDALLMSAKTASSGIDAVLISLITHTIGLDAMIEAAKSGSVSLDAILVTQGQFLATANLDALIRAVRSGSLSLDAILQGGSTAEAELDAMLAVAGSASVSLDAVIRSARSVPLSVDGLLQAARSATLSIDSLLRAARSGALSVDAVIVSMGSPSALLDAVLRATIGRSLSLDAIIGYFSDVILPDARVVRVAASDRLVYINPTDRLVTVH
jgi:hypothetical protein